MAGAFGTIPAIAGRRLISPLMGSMGSRATWRGTHAGISCKRAHRVRRHPARQSCRCGGANRKTRPRSKPASVLLSAGYWTAYVTGSSKASARQYGDRRIALPISMIGEYAPVRQDAAPAIRRDLCSEPQAAAIRAAGSCRMALPRRARFTISRSSGITTPSRTASPVARPQPA